MARSPDSWLPDGLGLVVLALNANGASNLSRLDPHTGQTSIVARDLDAPPFVVCCDCATASGHWRTTGDDSMHGASDCCRVCSEGKACGDSCIAPTRPATSPAGVPAMSKLWLALVLVIGVASTAEAQKNCTKGILCGNSCISASKVCRIESSSPTLTSKQAPSDQKPNCTVGVPCGNSCISADRVCRIESAPSDAKSNTSTARPRDERAGTSGVAQRELSLCA
jgi:hypothetical protein